MGWHRMGLDGNGMEMEWDGMDEMKRVEMRCDAITACLKMIECAKFQSLFYLFTRYRMMNGWMDSWMDGARYQDRSPAQQPTGNHFHISNLFFYFSSFLGTPPPNKKYKTKI